MNFLELKKVKGLAYKLKGTTTIQWNNVQTSRVLQGKGKVKTLHHMRHLLRERFLPLDYVQTLFRKYNNCHQGARTIEEYAHKFQRIMEQNNLHGIEAQIVG